MELYPQAISQDVLLDTYAQPGETSITQVRQRIAQVLAQAEAPAQRASWQQRFVQAQAAGFIPAGRIAANAGAPGQATMVNCFVQPVGDSISHPAGGQPGIYTALAETAETLRLGGGVGMDFSSIRPHGAQVAGTATLAAGPVAFMHLFDSSCAVLSSMAQRSGAQMGVLRCDHPDIETFVSAKNSGGLSHFNLSVAVTNDFMRCLAAQGECELVHAAEPGAAQKAAGATRRADGLWRYRSVSAPALWDHIVRCAHGHGEPGVLFIDRINAENNLAYCEQIAATNPCGEQPLPPYGACCLGSVNLAALVSAPFEPNARLDFDQLEAIVPTAVRMLDNVLSLTQWPLPQQREQAKAKRRIGLGFTGLGDALVMLGLHYDSVPARSTATRIATVMRDAAYRASVKLARERGAFPVFDADQVLRAGSFASRLPPALQAQIRQHGLRNSHLLCIAPAGSVSLAFADNTSSGVEPAYAWRYTRHRRNNRHQSLIAYEVEDHAWRLFQHLRGAQAELTPGFVSALELSPQAHLAMVEAVMPCIDGAISKTVNAPAGCDYLSFQMLYREAWDRGLKGVTAFRPNRVLGSVLQSRRACTLA